jgi:hypothetical protein
MSESESDFDQFLNRVGKELGKEWCLAHGVETYRIEQYGPLRLVRP